jgi:hypothetical protein
MTRTPHSSTVRLLPPEELYWAVLRAPVALDHEEHSESARGGALLEALQGEIPAPVEELHAKFVPGEGGGRSEGNGPGHGGGGTHLVIACAVPLDRLTKLAPGATVVRPATLPAFLPAGLRVDAFNLLCGSFEPRQVRAARTTRAWILAAAMCGLAALLWWGLDRRTSAWSADALAARRATLELAAQAGVAIDDVPRAEATMTQKVASLRQIAAMDMRDLHSPDASDTLSAWLSRWPSDDSLRVRSLSIQPWAFAVTTLWQGEDREQASAAARQWIARWTVPPGWELNQPQVQQDQQGIQVQSGARRMEVSR